ncbi:pentatricopeptide repeat-containing protein At5g67570, chloroplastic isoform X1 [Sesamum indicum]|uniref:Pentatricopeptide repeat-containing protein At5g67570, chloroplastic isoform X1 n=2 Tax=Sesamum indicum TaxID=4182 RepID=A0A6I9UW89_SESIN|nr:pentatricopeptide repeat-containing protein At5g67570, chloroplastic isoform X1 [Sesamum indicum]
MEASTGPLSLPPHPNLENIKHKLLKHGVHPTPRILHNLRKKELQKSNRRLAKLNSKLPPPLTDAQKQSISEESHFHMIKSDYKKFTKSVRNEENKKLVGRPWERLERLRLRELSSENMEYDGERLNPEHLRELSDIIECERDKFAWLLDNDIELEEGWFENDGRRWAPPKRSETEAIRFLIDRLSATELSVKDWKFTRTMKYSGLQFTERQMMKIVEGLGDKGHWRHAFSVVEWVYNSKEHSHFKSRFVYTKLLAVLGRARKPREALQVFNLMRGDAHIYPDMAAYHSLAVTLGQAGFLKELLNVIESMKAKPKKIRNMRRKNWNPELLPDIVIFNAVLNACVSTCQWKGVSWVFQQLRKNGLRPNGASYGLAMEVMLKSGKYDLVHDFFWKMKRNGEALKAVTYKVLIRAFREEGKVDEAVQAVRDMERRGLIGTASVYYELACCLCFYGRWQDAILEIEKLKNVRSTRPLAVTFTGMIMSSMDGGHVNDCVSLYEHSKTLMSPDIGLINAMLKVYGRNDMFLKAKELFEETIRSYLGSEIGKSGQGSSPKADMYTFSSMLEAAASALQWEYFEYVYKEMTLSGHQLDHHTHSAVLVEASRAGKWHLLEHAFDSILEAGEIPPLSFFTEMGCQAITRDDYGRAVNIINTMAHAPFQVSFQEWINLFERNSDRIDWANLNKLQEQLVSCDLVKEATVLNLCRALQFICGCCEDSLNSIPSTSPRMDELPKDSCDGQNFPANTTGSHLDWNHNILEDSSVNTTHDDDYMSNSRLEEDRDSDEVSGLSDNRCEGNVWASTTQFIDHFNYDAFSQISPSYSDHIDFEHIEHEDSDGDEFNFELIIPNSEADDSQESAVPSAYEILESWKKK